MAQKTGPRPTTLSVYLYIPNIIALYVMLLMAGVLGNLIKCQPLELFWTCTACLLVVLSQVYKYCKPLAANVRVNTLLLGKASHKDVKDSSNWLFKAYYGNRMFMAYCCVSCAVLYLILFFLLEDQIEKLLDVLAINLQRISVVSFLIATSLFGWAIKQIINIIQTAADVCVLYDIDKK